MNKRWWWMVVGAVALMVGGAWFWTQAEPVLAAPEDVLAAYTAEVGPETLEADRPGPRRPAWCRPEVTRETFVAQALGVDEETLRAAQQQGTLAWIDYQVEQGLLDAAKADLLKARVLVRPYLDPVTLTAQALGLTEDDLQQACAEGKTLADLLEQQGMTRRDFVAALKEAAEQALQQAVDDGVITQEQADALKQAARRRWEHRPPRGRRDGAGQPPAGPEAPQP